jgi:hypothetical protein
MVKETIPAVNSWLSYPVQEMGTRGSDGRLGMSAESRFQQTLRIRRLFKNIFFLITEPGTAGA